MPAGPQDACMVSCLLSWDLMAAALPCARCAAGGPTCVSWDAKAGNPAPALVFEYDANGLGQAELAAQWVGNGSTGTGRPNPWVQAVLRCGSAGGRQAGGCSVAGMTACLPNCYRQLKEGAGPSPWL